MGLFIGFSSSLSPWIWYNIRHLNDITNDTLFKERVVTQEDITRCQRLRTQVLRLDSTALRWHSVDFLLTFNCWWPQARSRQKQFARCQDSRSKLNAIDAIIKPRSFPRAFIDNSNSNTLFSLLLGSPTAIRKLWN